jgi:hypothetical protein
MDQFLGSRPSDDCTERNTQVLHSIGLQALGRAFGLRFDVEKAEMRRWRCQRLPEKRHRNPFAWVG